MTNTPQAAVPMTLEQAIEIMKFHFNPVGFYVGKHSQKHPHAEAKEVILAALSQPSPVVVDEQMRADAERYRWLRRHLLIVDLAGKEPTEKDNARFDKTILIDAARKETPND